VEQLDIVEVGGRDGAGDAARRALGRRDAGGTGIEFEDSERRGGRPRGRPGILGDNFFFGVGGAEELCG
jgi:hypothetical protein